jgi:ubiquitin carboxyl-terminal hydrolase L5
LNFYCAFICKLTAVFPAQSSGPEEESYHFVGYMPIDGRLYELDGLKAGPIDLGTVTHDSDWLDIVRPIIEKRISKYVDWQFQCWA